LFQRVEQAEQVNFFFRLQFHARQDNQLRTPGGINDGPGVGAGVVVSNRQQVDTAFQRFLHDQRRDHLHVCAGGEHRVNMQFGAVGVHMSVNW
jgi:hypothetical protein